MTTTKSLQFALLAGSILLTAIAFVLFQGAQESKASAAPDSPPRIATSSNPALPAGSAQTLIATSSCSARVVSTASTTLMLTFTDRDTPSAVFGAFQAASTTKEYDSSQYGCGKIKAFAFTAGTVTVLDAQ